MHDLTFHDATVPPGAIIAYAGKVAAPIALSPPCQSPPLAPIGAVTDFEAPLEAWGWMVCDGRSLCKAQYPELFHMIGNLYGGTDDGATFNLPNLEGQFLRGIGTSKASVENRTKAENGEEHGVGSRQASALETHVHGYKHMKQTAAAVSPEGDPISLTQLIDDKTDPPETSDKTHVSQYETRPTNTFVYYIIKYTSKLPNAIN